MRNQYQIVRVMDGEAEVIYNTTRKADVEREFNRRKRFEKKYANNGTTKSWVRDCGLGYFKVDTLGTFSSWTTEYYIQRA